MFFESCRLLFRRYINARALRGVVWWSFRGVGCSLLVVMFEEETRRNQIQISLSLFLLSIFLSLLSSDGGEMEVREWEG